MVKEAFSEKEGTWQRNRISLEFGVPSVYFACTSNNSSIYLKNTVHLVLTLCRFMVILATPSKHFLSLVGCSPWGRYDSDTAEWLQFHFSLSRIGEGNGNPLQCSCLENPRDGGAWWAAVYGVTQSRTWLKWLSSSSSSMSWIQIKVFVGVLID